MQTDMTLDQLRNVARQAIALHEREYGVTCPQRLKDFYASSFTDHQLAFVEPSPQPSGYGPSVGFQLELVPPTWLDKDDDAINGPDGEWEAARHFLPIFVSNGQTWVVVDLRTPECAVGWYVEETFRKNNGGYQEGVLRTADSLDDFLASLKTSSDKEDVFREEGDRGYIWFAIAAEQLGDGD